MGASLILTVTAGNLVVGTWQQVFIIELDIKRRERELIVTVKGD